MALEYMILFLGFMISEIMVGCQTMQDNNTVIEIIKVAIPAVVTFIGVFLITRKKKHNKSTEAINKLIRQLGMKDEETLKHELSSQYNNVMESIGRGGKASLTEQHAHLESCIQESYKTIEDRYKKEDDAYALFTSQQRDLAETMNNFTKDYKETISDRNRLLIENETLKKRLETLQAENKMLRELSRGKKL
ncbi:hypothetical protein DXC24_14950 [Clostridium sp. OM08-29]|nr:hypothetical protein DXC24_14950 [Clostridium sp. OM08-29]